MEKINNYKILDGDMESKKAREKEAKFRELMGENDNKTDLGKGQLIVKLILYTYTQMTN